MFKKIIFLLLMSISVVNAGEINLQKSYSSAMEVAKKENKPVFYMISNENCPPCRRMAATTLKDENIIKMLNKEFISVISYTNLANDIPRKLHTGGTPTLWFLLIDGTPMYQPIMGGMGAQDFLLALKAVKKEFNSVQTKGK